MNLQFLRDLGNQLARIWREIKIYQKFTVILAALFLIGVLIFLVVGAVSTRYDALYPVGRITINDAAEIKAYLDSSRIPYKIKADTLILVAEREVHRIRMDLAAIGLPQLNRSKGFELFDQDTWIKGEKELQILEMRALIGQLERDVTEYDNITSASVVIDLAPPRPFGGTMYKTKASIILDLMPGARLGTSQLRAITYHISGAVRGLAPNMIAISDTDGKLYQAIDPNGEIDLIRAAEMALEERIKTKVDGMLAMIVGRENFYSSIQVVLNRERSSQERKVFSGTVNGISLGDPVALSVTESGLQLTERETSEVGTPGTNTEAVAGAVAGGAELLNRQEKRSQQYTQMAVPVDHIKIQTQPGQIQRISIAVMIDKTIAVDSGADLPEEAVQAGHRNAEQIKAEVESQLTKILEGYGGAVIAPAVDFVEFDKTVITQRAEDKTWGDVIEIGTKTVTVLFILLVVIAMFWTFNRFWKRHMMQPPLLEEEEEEHEYTEESSLMELEAMIESIKIRIQNDPQAVLEVIREWLAEEIEFGLEQQ
ncbi:flagellar M-ring protein FliF [Simkania negevensis]|uniref:Flagellar M-ring protein FliF n=1 Tax=Simkania negevensis TaxID=83561 RepID=A0ABS3APZ2_9BACT|nr:flagellar M-ring protein FliF [Simkania negevensis]